MIFLGDYIDYGEGSFQVLQYIWELQKYYGDEKVIVLKGNHEQMFLEWINDFRNPYADGLEDYMTINDWLRTDFEYGANTYIEELVTVNEKQPDGNVKTYADEDMKQSIILNLQEKIPIFPLEEAERIAKEDDLGNCSEQKPI